MPLISVIMPVYKVEKYIKKSINTICMQTFKDFELILVDDGTPDQSIEIAKRELEKSNLNYSIIKQTNQGVSAARNVGISNSSGEWIICIDPDDGISTNTFETLTKLIVKHPEIDVWGINFRMVNSLETREEDNVGFDLYDKNKIIELFLLRKIRIITPGLLIRKTLIEQNKLFYDKQVKFTEDLLYIWNLLLNINEFGFVHNQCYQYLERPESTMTSSTFSKINTGYKAFKKMDIQIKEGKLNFGEWGKYIFPRWLLGTLKSSARHMSFKEYKTLTEEFDYKRNLYLLRKIPDWKTQIVTKIILYSRVAFYWLAKMRKI